MTRIVFLSIVLLTVLSAGSGFAGTIYTWTGADGVRRYSNSQPPEGAENVQTLDELEGNQTDRDRLRREYDNMVEKAGRQADEHFKAQEEKKARQAEAERTAQEAKQAERIAAERAKLQEQINTIKGRGLGPTFSPGQKAAMIEKIQAKIDLLERDPKAYFKE